MAITIPRTTPYVIKRDDVGIPVYALQRALTGAGIPVPADFAFGAGTLNAVKRFQDAKRIEVDGVVGPMSQQMLGRTLCELQERRTPLPPGMLEAFCAGEGGWMLAAVSWKTPGGVDCGMIQRRVYEGDYGNDVRIKLAFDLPYQLAAMAADSIRLHGTFMARTKTVTTTERAWRLCILNHNYPYGADLISRVGINGLPASWRRPATWVQAIGARLPDGYRVETAEDWCRFYALGWPHAVHNWQGLMTKGILKWP